MNLSFTDIIALVITPAAVGTIGFIKYLEADKEKHAQTLESDKEKDIRRNDADVEREKIKADLEVQKERERSLGGEAVVKIWKEVSSIQEEIKNLRELQIKINETQQSDHSNDLLVNEIIKRLQEDVSKLMSVLLENLSKPIKYK